MIVGDEPGCVTASQLTPTVSRSARSAGSEAVDDHYWNRGRQYTHGTYYSYTHGACRCAACREANRVACWLRRNGLGPGLRPLKHGTTSFYNKGCRCEFCREAQKERRGRHWIPLAAGQTSPLTPGKVYSAAMTWTCSCGNSICLDIAQMVWTECKRCGSRWERVEGVPTHVAGPPGVFSSSASLR